MREFKRLWITTVAVAVLFVGFAAVSDGSGATAEATEFSDEEVALGIVFRRGPVAQLMGDEITSFPGVTIDEYESEALALLAELEAADPGFLGSISSKFTSGDPVLVRDGLEETNDALFAHASASLSDEQLAALTSGSGPEGGACSWAVACVAYAALAVHNTVAVTALVAGAVGFAIVAGAWFWGRDNNAVGNDLAMDRWVASVATTLGG